MAFLEKVSKGKIKKPHLVLVYGTDSVGKSTFGSQAPNPIFLGTEDGTNNLDVARFNNITSWDDVIKATNELISDKHDFKSLVIDSLDWLEPILHRMICERHNVKSIELASGGYGKGYIEALGEWQKFIGMLSQLREKRGMNVVMIAHSQVIRFSDPSTQSEYDRYELKLYKKSAALFREYVDSVLFANFEIFSKKDNGKTRAYGDGARVLFTERRPGFDAKNRFGLPFQLPLSWSDYEMAIESAKPNDPEVLLQSIIAMVAEITDDELKKKVMETVEKSKTDGKQLEAIKNRLAIRLGAN